MNKLLIEDVLSWDKFLNETLKEDSRPPKKIKLFKNDCIKPHIRGGFLFIASHTL